MRKIVLIYSVLMVSIAVAQKPKQWSSSEIYQKMRKLNVLGNVLYLAAHPDDENTRFISYCANEKLFNTAYLSLTRGDGGQNLIGPEIREELGIIRTQELLAARRMDGGQQFFSRANDFGYSKTPDETLEIWDKEKILGDVVWVIRKFRPDVIVCRFPTDGGGGHGHHTSSAILAKEAFEIAGDKTKYPEQLKYVDVWEPKRVVVNTGRWWNPDISEEDEGVVADDIGLYNPMQGISYNELAALSRTQHKSQGFGSTGTRGEHIEYFEHLIGKEAKESLFEDFPNWMRYDNDAMIQSYIGEILLGYKVGNPSGSIELLLKLRKEILKITDDYWKKTKIGEIDRLILQCAGIYLEAKADEFSKTLGDSLKVDFEMINRGVFSQVKLKSIKSTQLNFEFSEEKELGNNVKLEFNEGFVTPKLAISQPYWLENEGTLGTYNVSNQNLIGKPENEASVSFIVELDVNGQIIKKRIPLIYKWNDPVKGELYRPFIITPKVTANIEQPIYLFSDKNAKNIDVMVKAQSDNQSGKIEVKTPKGWSADYNGDYRLKKMGDEIKISIEVIPNDAPQNGNFEIYIDGNLTKSVNTIQYDHIPTQVWFPDAKSKLVYVDIKKSKSKIGYILGAGDVVPDALRTIGYQVDILEENDLEQANLTNYDAILTGVRFFNVNERSPFMAPKLMKYVEDGGNLIVQYNTRHRMKTQDFGPYPIKLSRDRVTEEDAVVTFLKPEHSVLTSPNKITKLDFEGWVQERGLYFPNEWDEKYDAILSWHDKGENAKNGSLLVAKYGKGNYVYTGISFFRELPAGVPGAYRLLVNLIELE